MMETEAIIFVCMQVIKARASEENVLVFGQDSAARCVQAKGRHCWTFRRDKKLEFPAFFDLIFRFSRNKYYLVAQNTKYQHSQRMHSIMFLQARECWKLSMGYRKWNSKRLRLQRI